MLTFVVYGKPEPQGSTKAFIPRGWKRPVITSDNKKMKPWRQQVAGTAINVPGMVLWKKKQGGIAMNLRFVFMRPASLPKFWTIANKKPDADKLQRAIFDALTGITYEDDSMVVSLVVEKVYGTRECVEIGIEYLSHGTTTERLKAK